MAAILGISDLNKTRITTVIGIIPQPDLLSKIVFQLFGGILLCTRKITFFGSKRALLEIRHGGFGSPEASGEIRNEENKRLPEPRVPERMQNSPAFSVSPIEDQGKNRNSATKDLEIANSQMEGLRKQLNTSNSQMEGLRKQLNTSKMETEKYKLESETARKRYEQMIEDQLKRSSSSQEELLLSLDKVKLQFQEKEIMLTNKLEESNRKQLEMKMN